MFRFFKYDETGYMDFGNSVFSNLDKSQFDTSKDKLTIDETEYRISTIKEICDNCNNSETETYLNETMTKRYPLRTITTPGAKGTIPATNDHADGSWLPTDLYNGEILINTTDHYAYIRSGNEIRAWQLVPIIENQPINFEYSEPESLTIGNPPVEVQFHGSGLEQITGIIHPQIPFGVIITDFRVINQNTISVLIDTSEADLGGTSGEVLEVPFIADTDDNLYAAPIFLHAQSTPQGDPVITSIEPYGTAFFVQGEQIVKISGTDLNSKDNLSIISENEMITVFSYELDADNNITAQMDIPAELLDTLQSFVLSYDGYMTEPFQVILRSQELPPPEPLSIIEHPSGVTADNINFNIILNHDINELSLVEVQSEFDVIDIEFNYVQSGVVEIHLDTSQMNYGETFRLRARADGETSDWTNEIIIM